MNNASFFRLRTSLQSANELIATITRVREEVDNVEDKNAKMHFRPFLDVTEAAKKFENVLSAELSISDMYMVAKKGAFDMTELIENGQSVFPSDLTIKVPEAIIDVRSATKCIAYELATAAAFHLHRANEAVLHKYYGSVASGAATPKSRNVGDYLNALDQHNAGDAKVKSTLNDLKDLHRNPIVHPEQNPENIDEAIALMGQVNAVITLMLKEITAPSDPLTNALTAIASGGAVTASTATTSPQNPY
jgi:hypothetical protein